MWEETRRCSGMDNNSCNKVYIYTASKVALIWYICWSRPLISLLLLCLKSCLVTCSLLEEGTTQLSTLFHVSCTVYIYSSVGHLFLLPTARGTSRYTVCHTYSMIILVANSKGHIKVYSLSYILNDYSCCQQHGAHQSIQFVIYTQ